MAAEIGNVGWYCGNLFSDLDNYHFFLLDSVNDLVLHNTRKEKELIPCLDFINKLRMSEEEARELEDNRVELGHSIGLVWEWSTDYKSIKSLNGHKFRLSDDCKEVSLVKDEKC